MSAIVKVLKEFFQPFEILYLSVAVATFSHTTWAAAFLFEGVMQPGDEASWYFRGALIAIAIDIGMLVASRSLAHSRNAWNTIVLGSAFAIAAVGSFYTQVVYITAHTPEYQVSPGVSDYWQGVLQPVIDARVIVLPFMLPLLATVYTLARIFKTRSEEATGDLDRPQGPVHQPVPVQVHKPVQGPQLKAESETPLLESGDLPDGLERAVNWDDMTFYDDVSDSWKGPFRSEKALVTRYKALQTLRERKGLPKYARRD